MAETAGRGVFVNANQPSIAKFTRPTLTEVYARPRLFKLLDRALGRAVVWISGAPGAGKTTLVADYLAAQKGSILWYQLDGSDADPATFFYYMSQAAKRAAPRYKTPLPLLTPEYRPGLEAFTRQFMYLLCARLPKGCVLVLDNYHAVPLDSPFHEVIRFLFDAMPEGRRVIVISRGDPPPSLARLRASQGMEFVDAEALRATPQETRGIARLKHRFSEKAIRALHEMTDGWVAGIILMVQRATLEDTGDRELPGKQTREVFNYFAGEIFELADAEVQEFLLQTAFFEKMTVPMAEGLTGQQRSKRILADLVRRAYFTEKHGEAEAVYQYHALFRQFLLQRAEETWSAETLAQVRHRAALQLEKTGQIEEAVGLYQAAREWDGVARLALQQAPLLMSQGRFSTVEGWLTALPSSVIEKYPWLLYWLGISRLQYNPPSSRTTLEQAFELYVSQQDDAGSLLAWSGVVNSILHTWDWDEHKRLDKWMAWMDERMRNNPHFPGPDIEARVACDMAHILLFRKIDHPEIATWMERATKFARQSPDYNLRLQVAAAITQYDMWTGQFRAAGEMVKEIQTICKSTVLAPAMIVQAKMKEAMYFAACTMFDELARKAAAEGLEVGRASGIPLLDSMFYAAMVLVCMNTDQLGEAQEFLAKMESANDIRNRMTLCHQYYAATLLALCRDEAREALRFATLGMDILTGKGAQFPEMAQRLAMAQALHETGEHRAAARQLATANRMSLEVKSTIHYFMGSLTEAQFAFDSGKPHVESRGLKALREAMKIGREQGYITFPGWRSKVMARLCMKALEYDIEPEYARSLIRAHRLLPEPSAVAECEVWPWPIKIYSLGRFSIVRDGAPLEFAKRSQGKVIELLKALIALGGREVDEDRIAEALWPEAEGDKAHQAFKTTLHRLRKLLGNDQVISVHEGQVTLDSRYCWVDVRAVERLLGRNQRDFAATEKAMALYQGRFLEKETEYSWAMLFRERLHAKYLRRLSELGHYYETNGDWTKAVGLYHQGLNIDTLVEEYYQRLMVCHQRLGHRAEAVSVYRRCREALQVHLHIAPSPETDAIYRAVHATATLEQGRPSDEDSGGATDQAV